MSISSLSDDEGEGSARSPGPGPGTVVLLHGLCLGSWAMAPLAFRLRRRGFRTLNLDYSSRTVPLDRLGCEWLPGKLSERLPGPESRGPVHFVTHSMGGIVLRSWLRRETERTGGDLPPWLGRTVMIAPPNGGSGVVDRLREWPPFRWATGVNGLFLGTDDGSAPNTLGPWPRAAELGVIAGCASLNPLFSSWLCGPNDGKVSVESTRLEGMRAHVALPQSHTWIQWRSSTAREVCAFLENGTFSGGNEAQAPLDPAKRSP